MGENKEVNYMTASEARAKSDEGQKKNMGKAMSMINSAANQGNTDALLFGITLNLDDVQSLMGMGYSVSQVTNQIDFSKIYKIEW